MDKQKNPPNHTKEAARDDSTPRDDPLQPENHKKVEPAKENKKESEKEAKKQHEEEKSDKAPIEEKEQKENRKPEETEEEEEKERKRQQAISQSVRLLQEFNEDTHTELSPVQIVQLIVAERIYWLGSRLYSDEQLPVEELFATEQQLDFLSLLADKLAEPEIEVPTEVDEVYQQVIEEISHPVEDPDSSTLAAHNHTKADDDVILTTLAENIHAEEDLDVLGESVDEHQQHGAAIAFAITSLALACQHARHHTVHDTASSAISYGFNSTSGSDGGNDPTHVAASARITPILPTSGRSTQSIATSRPAPRVLSERENNITTPPQPIAASSPVATPLPLVAAAYAVASRDTSRPEKAVVRPQSPPSPHIFISNPRVEVPVNPGSPASPSVPPSGGVRYGSSVYRTPSVQVPERQNAHESIPIQPAPIPNTDTVVQPVEFWHLDDLLRVAHEIPLGHGRYLDSAYKKAEIDQEGLVKIIKDWTKGKQYLQTFEKQRAAFADAHKSPETLPEDYSSNNPKPGSNSDSEVPEPPISEPQSPDDISGTPSATATNATTQTLPDSLKNPINSSKEEKSSPTTLRHAILIVSIVLLFAVFLFFTL